MGLVAAPAAGAFFFDTSGDFFTTFTTFAAALPFGGVAFLAGDLLLLAGVGFLAGVDFLAGDLLPFSVADAFFAGDLLAFAGVAFFAGVDLVAVAFAFPFVALVGFFGEAGLLLAEARFGDAGVESFFPVLARF